jgi:hypothetical protein
MKIDIERLRQDLINYFGSAMMFQPLAIADLTKVENASPEELVRIAIANGFDLEDYKIYVR